MILLAIKTLILLGSFWGYFLYLQKKGIVPAFAPILTVSGISLVVFFSGLLNILPIAVFLILLLGLVCLVICIRACSITPPHSNNKRDWIPLLFFTALYFFFTLRVRNSPITSYDNFSHWMLVIRNMLESDQLPNFHSAPFFFQSYPTGTAGFIYYVCRCINPSEDCMLLGQTIIIISSFCVFWAFVKKHFLASGIVISAVSIYLLISNIPLIDLCVDTVLALVAIASFSALVYFRNDLPKAALYVGIIDCFIMLVKNSGIFFVLLHGILLICLALYDMRTRKHAYSCKDLLFISSSGLFAPLGIYYLWSRHVTYAFEAGQYSKHSMSFSNYAIVLGDKTKEEIQDILNAFITRICNPGRELSVLLICFGIYIVIWIAKRFVHQKPERSPLPFLYWSLFSYVAYLIGIAAMYLVSMPYVEAVSLGSFNRYLATSTQYLVGICILYILGEISNCDPILSVPLCAATLSLFLLLFPIWGSIPGLFVNRTDPSSTTRGKFIAMQEEYGIPIGYRYYIIDNSQDYGYLYFLASYELWSPSVRVDEEPKIGIEEGIFENYDFLIIMSPNEATDYYLSSIGLSSGQQVYNLMPYQ